MATNSMIAMGIRPIELNDPLAQYAKLAQIQGMRDQNAMSKYQMKKAEREDSGQNFLAGAVKDSIDPTTGEVNINALTRKLGEGGQGALIPDTVKKYQEAENAKTTSQKSKVDLLDSKYKIARSYLDQVDPTSPDAGSKLYNWTISNIGDPIVGADIKARLNSIAESKGMTIDEYLPEHLNQVRGEIDNAVRQGPGAVQAYVVRSRDGVSKLMELGKKQLTNQDTGNGGRVVAYDPLTGKSSVVEGSEFTKQLDDKQKADIELNQAKFGLEQRKFSLDQRKAVRDEAKAARDGSLEYLTQVEEAKTKGRALGTARAKVDMGLPDALASTEQMLNNITGLIGDAQLDKNGKIVVPKGGREPHPGFGQAVGLGVPGLRFVEGTDTADFTSRLEQLKSESFGEGVKAMVGMGALSNAEGSKITAAKNRASKAQSEEEFVTAVREVENLIRKGAKNMQLKTGKTAPASVPQDITDILNMYPGQ